MNQWFLLLPLIGAAAGACLAASAVQLLFRPLRPLRIGRITLQGIVPKRQNEFALNIGRIATQLFPFNELGEKITHPSNVKKIMPQAVAHIDHFLRVKLVKEMPVVGMFVGDRTINTLSGLFITELEELFPEIMSAYIGQLQQDINIEQLVAARISSFSPAAVEAMLRKGLRSEIKSFVWACVWAGFIIGLLQLLFIWWIIG